MHFYLLLMLSELLNAAAMTGSSSTIKFCFSAVVIPVPDALCDPILELFTNKRVNDVGEPLAWESVKILFVRQVVVDLWTPSAFGQDVVDGEPLVHWHVHLLHTVRSQVYSSTSEMNSETYIYALLGLSASESRL